NSRERSCSWEITPCSSASDSKDGQLSFPVSKARSRSALARVAQHSSSRGHWTSRKSFPKGRTSAKALSQTAGQVYVRKEREFSANSGRRSRPPCGGRLPGARKCAENAQRL